MIAPHDIRLTHVPARGAIIEAMALFVDGFVEAGRIAASDFIFEVAEFGFVAHLRHPSSENPPYKIIAALYNAMAGFHKAGADVEIDGPLAPLMPGAGIFLYAEGKRPSFSVRQIFEDQLPENERTLPIDPDALAEIHAALPAGASINSLIDATIFLTIAKDPRSAITWLLTHRSGLELAVLTKNGLIDAHCILGHRPLSAGRLFEFPIPKVTRVRSWGEAWIGHSWGGRRSRPEGLEILPEEVAIIHDVSVYRYEIDDRTTLGDLAQVTFGEGPSPFSASVWLGMAEQCGEASNYELAANCSDEAANCVADAQTVSFARQEAAHWRDWLAWSMSQPHKPRSGNAKSSPVRPVAELIARLGPGCAEKLNAVVHAMREERENAHDHRRRVSPIDGWPETGQGGERFGLKYERITGRDMIASGIPPQVLAHLGAGADPMPAPARFDDIFTLRCGDAIIWGSVETGCLVTLGDPAIAYSIDRR